MRKYIDLMESHSYRRVIPRDLFNEANLLKCYARIYIALESVEDHDAELDNDGEAFRVVQDESGGLTIANVVLRVSGRTVTMSRPLNSRDEWPLYVVPDWNEGEDFEEFKVFDEAGNFSPEMIALVTGKQGGDE